MKLNWTQVIIHFIEKLTERTLPEKIQNTFNGQMLVKN